MHRLKLIGLLVFLVVGMSVAFYLVVRRDYGHRFTQALQEDLEKTQQHITALKLLHTNRLKAAVRRLARDDRLALPRALAITDIERRHREGFDALQKIKRRWTQLDLDKDTGRPPPAISILTDQRGAMIARNRFSMVWKDEQGQPKVLRYELIGKVVRDLAPDKDVWDYREQNRLMLTVVAAPVLSDAGSPVGVLILGYEHNRDLATSDKADLSMKMHFRADIAYFLEGKVYATSLDGNIQADVERLYKESFSEKGPSEPRAVDVVGLGYLAIVSPFTDNAFSRRSGYILLASLEKALAPVQGFIGRLPIVAAAFLVVAVVLLLFILRGLAAPVERIEQGVMEITSGNLDVKFDADLPGQAGSLAHNLNLMVAALTGRPAPDEETEEPHWADALFIEELGAHEVQVSAPEEHSEVIVAPTGLLLTEDYYKRLFSDFTQARRDQGEQVDNVQYSDFREKLRKNEVKLCRKYACQAVKFQVLVKDGKVTLKPLPIKQV